MLTPFERLGGESMVRAIVRDFYAHMAAHEAELARLHALDSDGAITASMQERFALFLMGWLGGPQTYMQTHGHPRLRMRHGHVPVDKKMRDAWLRSMNHALDQQSIDAELRKFLDEKLSHLADFLRNVSE